MPKILIADDHAVVRKGLERILAGAFDHAVFGEAQNGQEALDLFSREPWDLLVLDVSMPVLSGLDVLEQLRHRKPRTPVLVLSMYPEAVYAVEAIRCGADGYLTKQGAPQELVNAVRKVLAGGKYVSPAVAEELAFHLDKRAPGRLRETLSTREFKVMRSLAEGKSLKETAAALSLSPKTISACRRRILEKMKIKTNAELTFYAIQNGIVGPAT